MEGGEILKTLDNLRKYHLPTWSCDFFFSHSVTSLFVWSVWSTTKKYLNRKVSTDHNFNSFSMISSSPCYHGHRITSLFVNISNRFVVIWFAYVWILSFHLDFCLGVGSVFWFGFRGFCWWREREQRLGRGIQQLLDDTAWCFLPLNIFLLNFLQIQFEESLLPLLVSHQ